MSKEEKVATPTQDKSSQLLSSRRFGKGGLPGVGGADSVCVCVSVCVRRTCQGQVTLTAIVNFCLPNQQQIFFPQKKKNTRATGTTIFPCVCVCMRVCVRECVLLKCGKSLNEFQCCIEYT